jgi:Flp pilus assembly protein CpaB
MGIVVMAILAGLLGAYLVRNSLLTEPVEVKAPPAPIVVPLATSDLPAGRQIAMGDIALVSMTPARMQEQGFTGMAMMMEPEQIIGRVAKEPIAQGQPFKTTGFYLEGTRGDFTANLRPGYRAYSMTLAKDHGGALPSGSMVDVFFRSAEQRAQGPGERNIPEVTVQLFQGVEIIDVYNPPPPTIVRNAGLDIRNMGPRTAPLPVVTLAVTPEQVQMLQTTNGRGDLILVARPENERVALNQDLKGKTLDDILGIPPPPQVVVFATEAFRGGERSVNVYRNDKLAEELSRQAGPPPSAPVDPPAAAPAAVVPVPVPVPVAPAAPPSLVPRVPPRVPMVPGPVGPVPMLP